MRRVDDDDIDASLNECRNAGLCFRGRADRRPDAQTTVRILARRRIHLGLVDVLHGNHAAQFEAIVNEQHLLDAMPVQKLLNLFGWCTLRRRDEAFPRSHHIAHGRFHPRLETHVTTGDDAEKGVAGDNGHAGNPALAGQFDKVADRGVRTDGDRILDHPRLVFLYGPHLARLLLDRHVLVNDADAALLRDGNRQPGFRDRVHGGRNERDLQLNVPGQARCGRDLRGQDFGVGRQEQNVIERESVVGDPQHGGPLKNKRATLRAEVPFVNSRHDRRCWTPAPPAP